MKPALALLILLTLAAPMAMASGKFDLSWGYFKLDAKTSNGAGSVSNFGAYQLTYRKGFARQLEFALGYSLVISKIYTGDMGYGPDLGVSWYPVTTTSGFRYEDPSTMVISAEIWRPYLNTSFHQRQYQSTASSYAGFSVALGTEYLWSRELALKSEVRSMGLTGPDQSTAQEVDVLIGMSIPF